MSIRDRLGRVRDSQFVIPAVLIAGSIGLVVAANLADRRLPEEGLRFLVPATISSGRTMLATIAGAIITVAALVFSLTALTVQMAASQYSPRIIQGFLRDRFQQLVLGVVIGTFTFSLAGLATLGADPAGGARADWTATAGVVLGVSSVLLIVAYIDYVTRRIRIDDTIRRLAADTERAFENQPDDAVALASESWSLGDEGMAKVLRCESAGWVQDVSMLALAEALPAGSVARVDLPAGNYATAGIRLATIWPPEGSKLDTERAHDAFAVGGTRSIDANDPGFGIRQLVDIALKALSPGINDPATAADVVRHLAGPVRAAYLESHVSPVYVHPNGTRLVTPSLLQPDDFARLAFADIRLAAATQPTTMQAMAETLSALAETLAADGVEAPAIRKEIDLLEEAVRTSSLPDADKAPILGRLASV